MSAMKKLFGGGGGGGSKSGAQQLFSNPSNTPIPSSSQSNDRDYRGQMINVAGMNVVIENKLAEGGFSIVFLVKHHSSRNPTRLYALKRQFVNEPALLEACRREIEITRTLGVRHPNIVTYIASSLTPVSNSDGNVYEYLLLTQYYRGSVLRLMNERLAIGQWLSTEEVLRIFTDVCAAVARLHHCQTPVIHRDLKVENLLLDEEGRCVLCDFGSATTRTLSTKTHSRTVVEDEIARFTTLSYRAPEMIDLYAGQPITTKVDIWALGVMLYKLCYFSLPFGESALGIQNAAFSFPAEPSHFPQELLGLIVYMLTPEPDERPDIYQVSSIAYRLRNCQCPVKNLNNVNVIDNTMLVRLLREHGAQKYTNTGITSVSAAVAERALKTPNNDMPSSQVISISSTTSVAPRQRPKPKRGLSPVSTPTMEHSLVPPIGSTPPSSTPIATVPPHVIQRLMEQSPANANMAPEVSLGVPAMPSMSRSATREEVSSESQHQLETGTRHPLVGSQQQYQQHRRNASDPSAALLDSTHLSAFKPYKSQQNVPTEASSELSTPAPNSWNPFDLDDHSFGLSFDALPRPRKDSNASTVNVKSRESLIIDAPASSSNAESATLDPFGAAPFRPRPQPPPKPANAAAILAQSKKKTNSLENATTDEPAGISRLKASALQQGTAAIAASSLKIKKGYKKLIEDSGGVLGSESVPAVLMVPPANILSSRMRRRSGECVGGADSDSVGSASDLQARMQASGSSTGEDDENIANNKEISVVDIKHGNLARGHHRRVRKTTSSDENENDDEEDNRSTDEAESGVEGDAGLYSHTAGQRYNVEVDEDISGKLRSSAMSSKAISSSSPGTLLLDEDGVEGGYLEQEMIGRQPLLADDDDEEQQQHGMQTLQSHVTKASLISVLSGGPFAKPAASSTVESVELTVLGGGSNLSTIAVDVFRRAPFLITQPQMQQSQALKLSSTNQHQQHYQMHQRPAAATNAASAFVNTSFQGDDVLRLD